MIARGGVLPQRFFVNILKLNWSRFGVNLRSSVAGGGPYCLWFLCQKLSPSMFFPLSGPGSAWLELFFFHFETGPKVVRLMLGSEILLYFGQFPFRHQWSMEWNFLIMDDGGFLGGLGVDCGSLWKLL
ncbi:hypothetical protein V6N13_019917 [Hibiscus sabdariffa]